MDLQLHLDFITAWENSDLHSFSIFPSQILNLHLQTEYVKAGDPSNIMKCDNSSCFLAIYCTIHCSKSFRCYKIINICCLHLQNQTKRKTSIIFVSCICVYISLLRFNLKRNRMKITAIIISVFAALLTSACISPSPIFGKTSFLLTP